MAGEVTAAAAGASSLTTTKLYEHSRSSPSSSSVALARLDMVPTRVKYLAVNRASGDDATWLAGVLTRDGQRLGFKTRATVDDATGNLRLEWVSGGGGDSGGGGTAVA